MSLYLGKIHYWLFNKIVWFEGLEEEIITLAKNEGLNIENLSKEINNKYGEKLGLVFQIKDDILDVVGNTNILGKNVHADEENNKTNFITVYGLEKCEELCKDLTEECISILKDLSVDTSCLINLTKKLLDREK